MKKTKDVSGQTCTKCGLCCRLFLINLNKKEYESGTFETKLEEFCSHEPYAVAKVHGGNFLKQKSDGSCMYLRDNLCSIHARRPIACRNFDCHGNEKKFESMRKIIKFSGR